MNHLKNEKSPYLLQHVNNPVDWYPWGKEAFLKAAAEDKPIFLSIGYSTCHWCHVMAHESFEDSEVADLLNREYISIKVDREERPDVDSVYMSACQAVTGAGGWPLTAILTPDQNPFFIGTYFPKHEKYGHPGLISILDATASFWKNRRNELIDTGMRITEYVAKTEAIQGETPDKSLIKEGKKMLSQQYDPQWGGFGSAPKFPIPHNLLFLLYYSIVEEPSALEMIEYTLTSMAQGGIFDHIGGGFSRYSTDDQWLAPHFEKMLYDNALLSLVYLEAYHVTRKEFYAKVAKRTLNYILRELTGDQGEFFCGQDADSEGVEGKYYVFTPDEIMEVLGKEDGREFCRIYHITESGNFENKSIPNLIGTKDKGWEEEDERLKKLYHYRLRRTKLHKDDKVILSWNGWTIMAMAKAAVILGDQKYLDGAVKANRFIGKHMVGKDRRLYLRFRDGEAAHFGQLDDYAVYGLALLTLYQASLEPSYLSDAVFYAGQMTELFKDHVNGGYFLTPSDGETLIARPKETYDGALPSGNSAAALLLERLSKYTGDPSLTDESWCQICFISGTISHYPAGHSLGMVALLEHLYPSKELICVTADEKIPKDLEKYLQEKVIFNQSILLKTGKNETELEKAAPFTKDYPIPKEGAVYYFCENGMCLSPVTELSEL